MSEENFYRCIPELNKECKKNNCYINGGECEMTIYKKYTLKGLLEEIERLKQQIDGIKSFCESFDLNKISDKERVMLDSIMLIANGTIKVVK